jgi:hypothetical protein
MFEHEQFAFFGIRAGTGGLRKQWRGQHQAKTNCPDHGALPIATFFAGAKRCEKIPVGGIFTLGKCELGALPKCWRYMSAKS